MPLAQRGAFMGGTLVSVQVPEELVGLIQAVVGVLSRFRVSSNRDFAAGERELGERMAELECGAVGQMLGALDEEAPRVEAHGKSWRRLNMDTEQTYFALRGPVRLKRSLYREERVRNGVTMVPVELRAGIVDGRYTPAAARGLAHLNQAMPSREADEVACSLGVLPFSRSTQFRGAVAVGDQWATLESESSAEILEQLTLPDDAFSVALSVDRASMPMAEERPPTAADAKRGIKKPITVAWRMAYTACWTLCDRQGKAIACTRYAHVPDGGALAVETVLRRDLEVLLRRRPGLKVVTLADGAPEMQQILDRVVAGHTVAARLVDFWHLAEHVAEALKSLERPVGPDLSRMKGYLLEYDSGIDAVLVELRDLKRSCTAPPPKPLLEAITYIENQRPRLEYATPWHSGLPIGSGHVEATGKTIIEVRMKRSGARWRVEGAQALLSLRALAKSSPARWDEAMKRVLAAYKAEVTPLAPRT